MADMESNHSEQMNTMITKVLTVDPRKLGMIRFTASTQDLIEDWDIEYARGEDYESLRAAAEELKESNTPVAFPTETVYGLGADATRSSAVKAIFAAKGRPSDNPLIVHIHSLAQLRSLLSPSNNSPITSPQLPTDPIPDIYKPLIQRFWPGPLTIILPVARDSLLAPEVTAGLSTFGARMPRSILALALLRLCDRPLAAPSANASTRPSPTAAEHVFDDLQGRIHSIIDGGPCEVGVESTVVDGLSSCPTILRPGGITVEQLRQCPGWENVIVGYRDEQEGEASKPKAPGMKYRHYSPRAEVVLYEAGAGMPSLEEVETKKSVGIIRTKTWGPVANSAVDGQEITRANGGALTRSQCEGNDASEYATFSQSSNLVQSLLQHQVPRAQHCIRGSGSAHIWDIGLGSKTEDVARGLFAALRELDKKGVERIYVEGIDDSTGDDIAAAVMNRLRKAAEIRV